MMKALLTLAAALLVGCIGGICGTLIVLHHERLNPQQVVRARSYELVDTTGEAVSRWGIDQYQNPLLAFSPRSVVAATATAGQGGHGLSLDDRESQRVAIGLTGDARPFFMFRGNDKRARVSLWVGEYGKPIFALHDENSWRVALGIRQTDTPRPNDDDWGLDFYPNRAGIGIGTVKQEGQSYVKGYLFVDEGKVSTPGSTPSARVHK